MGAQGYDSNLHRMKLSCRAIPMVIARRNTPYGSMTMACVTTR